ncbi:MAG: protein phosphatase 2C domain-containing protein, partial [Oscillospiraceae bacterium]|nr:protein phosphatase 2C domain-containing protein [Oscillospiraceae bacterium]
PDEDPKVENPDEDPKVENPDEDPKVENPDEDPKVENPDEDPKVENPDEDPKVENPDEDPAAVSDDTDNSDDSTPDTNTNPESGTTSGGMTTSPSEPAETGPVTETTGDPGNGGGDEDPPDKDPNIWLIVLIVSSVLFVADVAAIIYLTSLIKKEQKLARRIPGGNHRAVPSAASAPAPMVAPIGTTQVISALPKVATVHQVGRRNYQQDSLGHAAVLGNQGFLAVVADGMGGLSGGEKVSQKIVTDMLTMGHQLKPGQTAGILWTMVNQINDNVNRMLGPDGLYKSGSTLISVLVHSNRFQWISVGDSRIYLYREGYANQLNQDHDQLQAWMPDILEGRVSMAEAIRHPDGRKLTSFIGMGQLKHIDGSVNSIALEPGDRILLVSDGIYGIVDENRMADILKRCPDIDQAAAVIEQVIRESNSPHQDNYTAIILGF